MAMEAMDEAKEAAEKAAKEATQAAAEAAEKGKGFLESATNWMEGITGMDLDKDGDVGKKGSAQSSEPAYEPNFPGK